jgi:hypothetical protein
MQVIPTAELTILGRATTQCIATKIPSRIPTIGRGITRGASVRLIRVGERLTDMSDAAGTLWLDVSGRRW